MTTNYMLADMLTRIRNGQRAKIKSIRNNDACQGTESQAGH